MMRNKVWRDIRRSPAAALLVVLAVLVSAALGGLGAALGAQLASSQGVLFEQARVPHLLQMHAGTIDRPALERFAAEQPEVAEFQAYEIVGVDVAKIELVPGQSQATSSVEYSVTAQHAEMDLLIDMTGRPAQVAPGEVGIPVDIAGGRGIEVGDTVRLNGRDFRVGALIRDALMNSDLTSSRRFLVNEADLPAFREAGTGSEWLIEFRLTDPKLAPKVHDAYLAAGLPNNGPNIDLAMFQLMVSLTDGMLAVAVLVVAGLLSVIAALVLSITVRTSISAELRQIGVLRAIGLPAKAIRQVALSRHLLLVAVGAVLGTIVSIALTPLATGSLRQRMGGDPGIGTTLMSLLMGALVIVGGWLLARGALRPALRSGPLQVMRGATGRPKKPRIKQRSGAPTWWTLGLRQIRRTPADHITLGCIVLAATVLAALPLSLHATLRSPEFLAKSGLAASDLRVDLRHDETLTERLSRVQQTAASDPAVARQATFHTVRLQAQGADGAWTGINVESGDHVAFPVDYRSGRTPDAAHELALSELNADTLGADVGSAVPLKLGDQTVPFTVVGVYRDISNGGRTAKAVLPEGVGAALWTVVLIDLKPKADVKTVVERYADLAAPSRVTDTESARQDLLGGIEAAIGRVAVFTIALAVALTTMLSALVLRLFLVRNAARRAVAQAIGAPLPVVRAEYGVRLLVPTAIGVVVGVLLSPALGSGLLSVLGRFFGASGLPLDPAWLAAGVLLPLLLLGAVVLVVRLGVTRLNPSEAALLVAGQDL